MSLSPEVKTVFCQTLSRALDVLAERFSQEVKAGKFSEARAILDDIDLLSSISQKVKCPRRKK